MLVEHMALQPNFSIKRCADCQRIAAQSALVDENFELDAFEIEMNPNEILAGQRIAQRFKSDYATRQTPIVLMGCARGCGFFQRQPACLCLPRRTRAR